ncbi:MAG: hypothetical protein EOO43_04935 [Flavobacterium sp.]|nr:MAG: hypothetical protein EOO43_04935 [Flavobacterium sp.]
MNREEILKAYLEDEIFVEQGYLNEGDSANYKWATPTDNNLIQIIKLAIDGEISSESSNVTERKINAFLNK